MTKTRSATRREEQPVDSSTPRATSGSSLVTGRPPIHDHSEDYISMFSPIPHNTSEELDEENDDDSLSDSDTDSVNPNIQNPTATEENVTPRQFVLCQSSLDTPNVLNTSIETIIEQPSRLRILIPLLIFVCSVSAASYYSSGDSRSDTTSITLADIKGTFHSQSPELWVAFNVGISEIESFKKPSVFLLLYEDKSQETVNKLVHKISQYSVCEIKRNCSLTPLTLTKEVLNSERALLDYGNLISEYKPELESRGVMIVNNIDQIKGKVAQIFHSMCDEYTPLVAKAIFIFTMKIEKFPTKPRSDMELIEEVLYNNWRDIEDDIFYPLITRITNMVLRVFPET